MEESESSNSDVSIETTALPQYTSFG
jgi:hypothetical protein